MTSCFRISLYAFFYADRAARISTCDLTFLDDNNVTLIQLPCRIPDGWYVFSLGTGKLYLILYGLWHLEAHNFRV